MTRWFTVTITLSHSHSIDLNVTLVTPSHTSRILSLPLSDVQTSPGSLVGRGSGLRAQAGQDPLSLQSLYQAPGGRQGDSLSPYKRPSRDLQFNYVNTAKKEGEKFDVMKEEPSAQEILETLVRLVSPEDLEDLYIR